MSELLHRTIGEIYQIEVVLAGGLWRTEADPNELESALLNLVINARDAMPDGGKLTVETFNAHLDVQYTAISVSDMPSMPFLGRVRTVGTSSYAFFVSGRLFRQYLSSARCPRPERTSM